MEIKLGPDLFNSYAVVGNKDAENLWRTEIRSVLHKNLDWRKAYLTHECRAEVISPESIFTGENNEFTAIKSWFEKLLFAAEHSGTAWVTLLVLLII